MTLSIRKTKNNFTNKYDFDIFGNVEEVSMKINKFSEFIIERLIIVLIIVCYKHLGHDFTRISIFLYEI